MNGFSPWYQFNSRQAAGALWKRQTSEFEFEVRQSDDSMWGNVFVRRQPVLALRAAYFPGTGFKLLHTEPGGNTFTLLAETSVGRFRIEISMPDPSYPLVRCITRLTPGADLRIPFWPRDLMVLRAPDKKEALPGKLYVQQEGTRTGWLFGGIDSTDPFTFLYFQNLTALNDYAQRTKTSLGDTVGGSWPELGMGLPPSLENALPAGKEITIGDAFLGIGSAVPER